MPDTNTFKNELLPCLKRLSLQFEHFFAIFYFLFKSFVKVELIEDIYFFEVNTKYISSSAVKKISIFHECVARVKMLIFSPHEMKYI